MSASPLRDRRAMRAKIFGCVFVREIPLTITRAGAGDLTADVVIADDVALERPAGHEVLAFDGGNAIPPGEVTFAAAAIKAASIDGHVVKILAIRTESVRLVATLKCESTAQLAAMCYGNSWTVRTSYLPRRFNLSAAGYSVDAFHVTKIEIKPTEKGANEQ